jgi:hypothetical protein
MSIYKFKSKATGDLIMLGPNGDELLRTIGREPAAKGIIEAAAMPAAMAAIEAAVAAEEAAGRAGDADDAPNDGHKAPAISLRRRFWPMREMLARAHTAGECVVWGV